MKLYMSFVPRTSKQQNEVIKNYRHYLVNLFSKNANFNQKFKYN